MRRHLNAAKSAVEVVRLAHYLIIVQLWQGRVVDAAAVLENLRVKAALDMLSLPSLPPSPSSPSSPSSSDTHDDGDVDVLDDDGEDVDDGVVHGVGSFLYMDVLRSFEVVRQDVLQQLQLQQLQRI